MAHPLSGQHFVIIGGGLAGTFMAVQLIQAGQSVTLFDERKENSASRVAAGLFNIITGRFGAKSWQGEQLLAELKAFLYQPEFSVLKEHVHEKIIYRPFRDAEAYNKWIGRSTDPAFAHLVHFEEKPLLPDKLHNELGGIRILPCGWIHIAGLIEELQRWLMEHANFQFYNLPLNYSQINIGQSKLQHDGKSIAFDHLICCEGVMVTHNPWFSYLSVIPNKGEVLLIEVPDLDLPFVLSKKVYVIPVGEDKYVVGSTYFNKFEHSYPSEKGKAEICSYLEKAIRLPYRILDHRAGIRPTTPNRRPIVGTHSQYPNLHVCSGFGTKGLLLAPYCSRLLVERILGKSPNIPEEISVERFDD